MAASLGRFVFHELWFFFVVKNVRNVTSMYMSQHISPITPFMMEDQHRFNCPDSHCSWPL